MDTETHDHRPEALASASIADVVSLASAYVDGLRKISEAVQDQTAQHVEHSNQTLLALAGVKSPIEIMKITQTWILDSSKRAADTGTRLIAISGEMFAQMLGSTKH